MKLELISDEKIAETLGVIGFPVGTEQAMILVNAQHKYDLEQFIEWLREHNTVKGLSHAKYKVGLDLTYEDWQALQDQLEEVSKC